MKSISLSNMRRRPIRGNLRLDPEDQGQQKYDKYSKNKDTVGEKMKWILFFFAMVFGVIFCVVQLGGKAKQHLKGGINHIRDNYGGGLKAEPIDMERLREQMNDASEGHRIMNPDQEAYGDINEEYLAMEGGQDAEDAEDGYAQYGNIQAYDVDDSDLLEDIEDDLPPEEMPVEEDIEEEIVEYDAGQIDEEPALPAEGDAEAVLGEEDLKDLNPNEFQEENADVEAEEYIPLEEMEIEENDQGQERTARHRD